MSGDGGVGHRPNAIQSPFTKVQQCIETSISGSRVANHVVTTL